MRPGTDQGVPNKPRLAGSLEGHMPCLVSVERTRQICLSGAGTVWLARVQAKALERLWDTGGMSVSLNLRAN